LALTSHEGQTRGLVRAKWNGRAYSCDEGVGPAAEELLAEAAHVIDAAESDGLTMRLLGGVAVFHLASSARQPPLARSYRDFDVVVPARQGAAVARVFRQAGYAEDPHFNALHLPTEGISPVIDVKRFVRPLTADWGFFHTVEKNIAKVMTVARDRLESPTAQAVASTARRITEAMEAAPKSLKWKIRARAGERVPWYELPDEPEFRRPTTEHGR
jgi:hypothetical protein